MAEVYKSKISGEFGILDDDGRFSWASCGEAKECLAAGIWYSRDGEPVEDDDPLWDDLLLITEIGE